MSEPTQPPSCSGCPMYGKAKGFVLGCGDPTKAKYAIILEAPGRDEISFSLKPNSNRAFLSTGSECDRELEIRKRDYPEIDDRYLRLGVPVVGATGAALQFWIWPKLGIKREECFIDNTIRCTKYCTSVWMADGSWKWISKLVIGEYIRTYNFSTQQMELHQVVALTVTPKPEPEWINISVDGMHRGNANVVTTPDHEWFTPKGKKRANKLDVGDKVYLPQIGRDDLIIGTVLGDAHIREDGILTFSQTDMDWANDKAKGFGGVVKTRVFRGGYSSLSRWKYDFSCTIGKEWRKKFYRADRKKRWVDPPNAAALAMFYGDDGCLSFSKASKNTGKNGGKAGYYLALFACHSFNYEIDKPISFFRKKFGSGSAKNGGAVVLGNRASRNFFEYIAPWLPPSMERKLPVEYRGRYNGWLHQQRSVILGTVRAISRSGPIRAKKHFQKGYCLVVQNNNFFTRAGLVSNCLAPKGKNDEAYPTGEDRKEAELHCRQYDRLDKYRPDTFVVSLHPASLLREIGPLTLIVEDFKKVRDFTVQGRRVAALLGGKASHAYLRYASNTTKWRGDYKGLSEGWGAEYKADFAYTRKRKREPKVMVEGVCGKKHKGKKKAPSCGYVGCVEDFQRRTTNEIPS